MFDTKTNTQTGFSQFGLDKTLLAGIRDLGFDSPRPIQSETIPAGLEGRDVLGLAQTGTGKTAAFALPMLNWILKERRKGPCALILAPTRELATQISAEVKALAKHTRLKTVTIFGGVSSHHQIRFLRQNPEIVVGCPGRVLDLIQQGRLHVSGVDTLVLDEADHMFDMGFLPDIRKILAMLPDNRQNLLFSASMPKEVRHLTEEVLHKPHVVELISSAPVATIDHALFPVAEKSKLNLLFHMLKDDGCESAIVFTRTKRRAQRLAEKLSKSGHQAVSLQGNMSQPQRDRAMNGFRTRRFNILVATDIVARGIDVSGISHVINFDVPNTPEAYTHRIGRTGRAELEGVACTFITGADNSWIRDTERMIGQPIQRREIAGYAINPDDANKPRQQRGRPARTNSGRRPSGGRTYAPSGGGRWRR